MRIIYQYFLVALCCALTAQNNIDAQTIWPGDVNNNGKVTAVDLLYLGVAYGNYGPDRVNASSNWMPQDIAPWPIEFSNGLNYAFADADGDGFIGDNDLGGGIQKNYGLTHGNFTGDGYQNGVPGIHPELTLTPSTNQAAPGTIVEVDVSLGSATNPVPDFYGIAFQLSYDPNLVVNPNGIDFALSPDSWVDPTGGLESKKIVQDAEDGLLEVAFTKINHNVISGGFGDIGTFSIIIENVGSFITVDTIIINVDSVKLISGVDLETYPVAPTSAMIAISSDPTNINPSPNCPDVIAPVCGNNGITYLNSCYAEADGVTLYTDGVCYSDCVDPGQMDPDPNCPTVYDPVCGCNGITYMNDCRAAAAGIEYYSPGQCPPQTCFDPQNVVISGATNVDDDTGIITPDCPVDDINPVCGCDGITYQNACMAEASGMSFYTQGGCGQCIDPELMKPDTLCPYIYEPVCGCNDITYMNECLAEAAGVIDYNAGPCWGNSPWCEKAVPIQCGDFLPFESTVNADNHISNYPGCLNTALSGPENVYVLNKTTPGDLQIGLEITTPGLDLDIFLLKDNCNQVTCLAASTTSNSLTNNEGILFPDAAIGTYYIVVDGQFPSSMGNYRLEVSCGYLSCYGAQSLECEVPYFGSNIDGNDDVSLYKCGNILNVENNGPEVVHTFTIISPGQVDINLSNLSADLELFLLDACDASACMKFSQNPGLSGEAISIYLNAGTYFVVVDGYNGAISDYTLTVSCSASCNFDLNLSATDASCGQSDGSIIATSTSGTSPYWVSWSGPVSGSFTTYSNFCTISDLPAGTYWITKTDANGCTDAESITIYDSGNLNATIIPVHASCTNMGMGKLMVDFQSGQAPYHVIITGPSSKNQIIYTSNHTFTNLNPGNYTFYVIDNNGCAYSQNFVINQNNGLQFTAIANNASCGQYGSITVTFGNGVAPHWVIIAGPVTNSYFTYGNSITVNNLPGGIYDILVEDANWCQGTQQVVIETEILDACAHVFNGVCNQGSTISVNINGGTPPFDITWNGPVSGNTTTLNQSYVIQNLPNGTYSINITDAAGCADYELVTVNNSGNSLDLDVTGSGGSCGDLGFIWIDVLNGTAPYSVSWTGPSSGNAQSPTPGFDITNLDDGCYFITVTDAFGCQGTESFCLTNDPALNFIASPNNGSCGQNGSITLNIYNGTPTFLISWTGPVSGNAVSNLSDYQISNLPAGNYTVFITDGSGCSEFQYVTIGASGNMSLNTTPVSGGCIGLGSILVQINGGNGPYAVSWSGPVFGSTNTNNTTVDIPNLPSGTYTISVFDSGNCYASSTSTLSNNSGISVTTTALNSNCSPLGAIEVWINGSTPPVTISWSGPVNGFTTIQNNNFVIPNLPTGNYTIAVIDNTGCSDTDDLFLNNGNGVNLSTSANNGACGQNGSIDLTIAGGNAPFSISWTGPNTGSTNIFGDNLNIPNLPSGNYLVSVVDNDGCSDSETIWIDVEPGINLTATANNGSCGQNGSIDLTFTGGLAPIAISWDGPVTGTITVFGTNYNIPNLPSGNYVINVLDSGGCSDSQSIWIDTGSAVSLITNPINGSCGQNGTIDIQVFGANLPASLSWSGAANGTTTINSNNYTIPNLPSGDFTISIIDAGGCFSSQNTSLDNGNNIGINTTALNGSCGQNGSINVTISGATGQKTIFWSGPVNGSTTINNSVYIIPNLLSGSYSISITDSSGCTASQGVILTNGTNLNMSATPTNGNCGQYGLIYLSISNGSVPFTLNWTGPSNGSTTINTFNYTIPDLAAGIYTINVIDAIGCNASTAATVEINDSPIASVSATDALCDGASNGIATAQVSGGIPPYEFLWNTGQTTQSISNLPTGNYQVTVTDANNCTSTAQATIVSTMPVTLDVITTNVLCYGDATGNIQVTGWGGTAPFTYSWSTGLVFTEPFPNAGSQISGLIAGSYSITVTDQNNCTAVGSFPIQEPSTIVLSASVTNANCNSPTGSAVIYTNGGTAPFTYLWDNGQTDSVLVDVMPGTYTVTVTDAYFCTEVAAVTVDTDAQMPLAGFTESIDVLTVNFANTSTGNPVSFVWDFGDGGSSTMPNPAHQYCEPGTYQVCLTVTNACGIDTYCETIDIIIPPDVVILDVGESIGVSGSTIAVPVMIDQLHLLVSVEGTLQMADPTVGYISGLVPAAISPTYGAANNTFSFYDNSGAGVAVNSNEILFYVAVELTGTPGASSDVLIVDVPLGIEVGGIVNNVPMIVDHAVLKGHVSIPHSGTINGSIFTFEDEAVAKANVHLSNSSYSENYITGADGYYEFSDVPLANEYFIEPTKDTFPGNGLSTFALFIGQQFILGKNPPAIWSPYQIIAADVNCNGSFTTFDLFLIQQLILGTADEFSDCPSWVFVPEHHNFPTPFTAYNVFPYPTVDTVYLDSDTTVNFIGVKKGDILGQADPEQLTGNDADDRNTDILKLVTQNAKAEAGESVEFIFRSHNFDSIVAIQMALTYDHSKLEFETFEGAALNDAAMGQPNDSELRISWFELNGNGISLDTSVALFKVKFKVLEDIEDFSGTFDVGSNDFITVAHNLAFEELEIELEFEDQVTDVDEALSSNFDLHQNIPNPFGTKTIISFELPGSGETSIIIQNAIGEVIGEISGDFERGKHEVVVEYPNWSSGIYFYTLKSGNYHKTRKMVKY